MKKSTHPDPFEKTRLEKGYAQVDDQDDPVTMLLRYQDVRKTAYNWETFQSAAQPGRIVVPSEVNIRTTRQIPFEVDPPMHKSYRNLVEAWFKRPRKPEYRTKLTTLISAMLDEALAKESVEVIHEFSLPLQSRALTFLLNVPFEMAETWIAWGTHVFRSDGDDLDADKASILYDYIDEQIDKAIAHPREDLYSVLLNCDFEGRKLTKEEVKGVMILTFAGGRDTIINYVTNTIAYLAETPQALEQIRQNPKVVHTAVEELVRYFSPLTHMGRVVTEDTQVCEHAVKANSRVSLCWASANRDAEVFDQPNEVILDRKMNPHLAFGFSHHKCLGATHAREMMKILLKLLSEKVQRIRIQNAEENIEHWGTFERKIGYDKLNVVFEGNDTKSNSNQNGTFKTLFSNLYELPLLIKQFFVKS
ncbi:MAG: cytochrome P450 [Bacteroidota bacterium]